MDYSKFTNLYSLTKTLRFELKPTPETLKLLKDQVIEVEGKEKPINILQLDSYIHELYEEKMKPMYDELHRAFITESLQRVELDVDMVENAYQLFTKIKKLSKNRKDHSKEIQNLEDKLYGKDNKGGLLQNLRADLCKEYDEVAKDWKEKFQIKKGSGVQILLQKESMDILRQVNTDKDDRIQAIDQFKGFHGYFTGFNQNRANYYSVNGESTAVATRAIDQNIIRFFESKLVFDDLVKKISELQDYHSYFDLSKYNQYLTQEGIDTLNGVIGGKVENNEKVQGINEKINLWSQKSKVKVGKLKLLYKQIGSDKDKPLFKEIVAGQEWEEVENLISNQFQEVELYNNQKLLNLVRDNFQKFFDHVEEYEFDQIFINKASITKISSQWFSGGWQSLIEVLRKQKAFGGTRDRVSVRDVSLEQIREALLTVDSTSAELFRQGKGNKNEEEYRDYQQFFGEKNNWEVFLSIWKYEIDLAFEIAIKQTKNIDGVKSENFDKEIHGVDIKGLGDALLDIEHWVKMHKIKGKEVGDPNFYEVLDLYLEKSELITYYNAFRNYISKKPYSQDKLKLNFESSRLFTGWSDDKFNNHTFQYSGTILRNKQKYYLVILKGASVLSKLKYPEAYEKNNTGWELMASKLLKSTTIYGKSYEGKYKSKYSLDKEILSGDELVSRIKTLLKEKVTTFPEFEEIINTQYSHPNELATKLGEKDFFTPNFVPISYEFIKERIQNHEVYLFEIHNKDLKSEEGKDNVHTTYFKNLFSDENLKSGVLKLDANAEVFYREGQKAKLKKKFDNRGKEVLDAKRYAVDKYFFHCPIKINYSKPKQIKFKDKVIQEIQQSDKLNFIGIDRGEKHLIYVSVINSEGEILEQKTLNVINGVNYEEKLSTRAGEMMEARKSWKQIGTIKNFKEGYLSQAVHEIYQLAVKYNALIVLEDLNTQFKAKRTAKVEKSVYKKFELALARKLSHLILKDRSVDEEGGVLKAYQLVPYIKAGDIGMFESAKQWGIMMYVRANYTSTTDPVTGWRKQKYISNGATRDKIRNWFLEDSGIKEIGFDPEKQSIYFIYDDWILHAFDGLERFRWKKDAQKMETVHVYEELKELFEAKNIRFDETIFEQISEFDEDELGVDGKSFWKSLAFYWNMLNQIRNTNKDAEGDGNDFLQSPVYSEKIQGFYDSRKSAEYKEKFGIVLPENGDANGAYNTARKGIIMANRMKKGEDQYITDEMWDAWTQKNSVVK